jgi:hypothetical protein
MGTLEILFGYNSAKRTNLPQRHAGADTTNFQKTQILARDLQLQAKTTIDPNQGGQTMNKPVNLLCLLMLFWLITLSACAKMERAAARSGAAVQQGTAKIEHGVEKVGDKIGSGAEKGVAKVDRAGEKVDQAAKRAGEKLSE